MWDVHCFDYKRFILVLFCQVLVRHDTGLCHCSPDFALRIVLDMQ